MIDKKIATPSKSGGHTCANTKVVAPIVRMVEAEMVGFGLSADVVGFPLFIDFIAK